MVRNKKFCSGPTVHIIGSMSYFLLYPDCVKHNCTWPIFLHETPWFEYNCTRKQKSSRNPSSCLRRNIHLFGLLWGTSGYFGVLLDTFVACSYKILWPKIGFAYFGLFLECKKAQNWNQWLSVVNGSITLKFFVASGHPFAPVIWPRKRNLKKFFGTP